MFKPKDRLDRLFEIGIILKGLNGLAELVGGLLLLFVSAGDVAGSVPDDLPFGIRRCRRYSRHVNATITASNVVRAIRPTLGSSAIR